MNHLGLFAKYWQPGQVKTRLAARIGPRQASGIYYAFLSHSLVQLGKCGDERTIAYDPVNREFEFARLTHNGVWGRVPQHGRDLGERMSHFFEWAFGVADLKSAERTKVVLIGSDTPQLAPLRIEQAFTALDDSQIVLGPSSDGGYYLIGMADRCWPVFENVNWSTPQVMDQTLHCIKQLGTSWKLLPVMTDVDELDDLEELTKFLKSNPNDSNKKLLKAINAVDLQAEKND